jgi:hypothetical protein
LDRAVAFCTSDARRRLRPTVAARELCELEREKLIGCGARNVPDVEHCVEGHKFYGDAVLHRLTGCFDNVTPCRVISNCVDDVIGPGPAWMGPERVQATTERRLEGPGPTTIDVRGQVRSDGDAAIAGAIVCRQGPKGPCVKSDAGGAFTLPVDAHANVALTVGADGFGSRLVPLATAGRSYEDFSVVLAKEAGLRERYDAFGARVPDDSFGAVFVTIVTSIRGWRVDGLTVSLDPASGMGPFYFTPLGDPDPSRRATSTWSSTLFARLPPGEVRVTVGPEPVACTTYYGGWPSDRPNSIRVPVVAGFETRVTVRCQ